MSSNPNPWTGFAATDGGTYTPHPAGAYAARPYGLAHLGHLYDTYQGESKWTDKIVVMFESSERMDDGRPYTISKWYTRSMHERATFRAHLEQWRGRIFTAEEVRAFDMRSILDKPLLLNVAQRTDGDGRVRAYVSGLGALPKGMECPPLANRQICFSVLAWDDAEFELLTPFLQSRAIESWEHKNPGQPVPRPARSTPHAISPIPVTHVIDASRATQPATYAQAAQPVTPPPASEGEPEFDDDIPF